MHLRNFTEPTKSPPLSKGNTFRAMAIVILSVVLTRRESSVGGGGGGEGGGAHISVRLSVEEKREQPVHI